jgi:non-ribosomal peptide synthetase component F
LIFLSSRELCKSEIYLVCVLSQDFTQQHLVESLPEHQAHIICLNGNPETFDRFTQENSETGVTPDNLAYVIYICSSTGQPNGVGITHSGVVNTLLDINHRFEVGAGDLAPIRLADPCSLGTYAFEPLTPLKSPGITHFSSLVLILM